MQLQIHLDMPSAQKECTGYWNITICYVQYALHRVALPLRKAAAFTVRYTRCVLPLSHQIIVAKFYIGPVNLAANLLGLETLLDVGPF